jgi:tetratricopeptide (TPR) repeat protein
LIAAWEAEAAAEAGPSAAQLAERASLLATARRLNEEQRYWEAIPLLDKAALIEPLVDDEIEVRRSAASMLEPFHDHIALLRDSEYERVLRDLWIEREKDPTNPVVHHLLLSSYYNLGVRGLQQGRLDAAKENLTEASRLAPDDEEIKRLVSFVDAYETREQDLLFRIYAKYLASRPI